MNDWVYIDGYKDPPTPPEGFRVDVLRDDMFGIVYAYRFIPIKKEPINE